MWVRLRPLTITHAHVGITVVVFLAAFTTLVFGRNQRVTNRRTFAVTAPGISPGISNKSEVATETEGFTESDVPISIISRAHTVRKIDCAEDRFLVWQGHTSGLGSNLVIGATSALTFAAYTNRSFVLGVPHGGFPYMNQNPDASANFSWKNVFDMSKTSFSPCSQTFSELSLGLSSQQEILENKKRVLVVNFDNGPGRVGWWHEMLMNNNISNTKPYGYYTGDASYAILKMFGSLSQEAITACLLREVLIYQKFNIRRSLRTSIRYVGIHARGGDKAMEVTLEEEDHFVDAIDEIKATRANLPSLYLSGDRLPVREAIIRTFGEKVFFLPERITNPTEISTNDCRYPCLFYDALFDILMLARGEIVLGTIGSGFSLLSIVLQRVAFGGADSFSWHVGQEHAGLQKYVMSHEEANNLRDSYFWDPRKDKGVDFGIVLSKVHNKRNLVKLLSVHPWVFVVSQESGMGAEAGALGSVHDCDLSNKKMYVTPGINIFDLSDSDVENVCKECHDRPFKILVASDQQHTESLHGKAEMKVVNVESLDKFVSESINVTLESAKRLASFISLLRSIQSNFGIPDITEETYCLQTFLDGLDADTVNF